MRDSRWWAVLAAIGGVALVYRGQTDIGLYYDDYHFMRPWSALELRHVWHGSWDPSGIESVFFRPLTSCLFALRFWLFGVNASAMHALSVTGQIGCALLVASVLLREGSSKSTAVVGSWLYAVHPAMPYAQVSWLTNQMHLVESALVLTALLLWQSVRSRDVMWWLALVPIAIAAFLIKEDGIMIGPALVLVHVLRSRVVEGRWPRDLGPITAAAFGLALILIVWRFERLGRLGGYESLPDLNRAVSNLVKGLKSVLVLWPTVGPDEIRTWLDGKDARCETGQAAGSLLDLPVIVWGTYDALQDERGSYRWTSDQATISVSRATSVVEIALRRPNASPSNPTKLTAKPAGGVPIRISLVSSDWTSFNLPFGHSALSWLRGRRDLNLDISSWFVPVLVDPRSSDLRRHGVELRLEDRR